MKTSLDHEQYEKVRKRTKQKKRLYFHFIFFLVGSVFFIILNKALHFHEELDWSIWAVFAWLFLLVIHFINIFIMKRFFGKEWERIETEKLLKKHKTKIDLLEKQLDKKGTFDDLSSTEDLNS